MCERNEDDPVREKGGLILKQPAPACVAVPSLDSRQLLLQIPNPRQAPYELSKLHMDGARTPHRVG